MIKLLRHYFEERMRRNKKNIGGNMFTVLSTGGKTIFVPIDFAYIVDIVLLCFSAVFTGFV